MPPVKRTARPNLPFSGVIIALLVGGALVATAVLYEPAVDPLAQASDRCSSPGLQTDPPLERLKLEGDEKDLLTTYGWVDPDKAAVRIPIERAMLILTQSPTL